MRCSPTFVDHFLPPRDAGLMLGPDAVGEGEYEGCGDLARFFSRVRAGRLSEVCLQTYGCGATSAASELVAGYTMDALARLTASAVDEALEGLPNDRQHAADVVVGALQAATCDDMRRRESHV